MRNFQNLGALMGISFRQPQDPRDGCRRENHKILPVGGLLQAFRRGLKIHNFGGLKARSARTRVIEMVSVGEEVGSIMRKPQNLGTLMGMSFGEPKSHVS